ncbi:hypothetical protein PR048_011472 [Dryococelus australis]|uniref:Uncharacterized protein n=1 Tax=Dryococelus australis TaxID=614101 RepID=A0ABQ9HLV4_9NEOP|nr:hypothetical protein PR048_011472 [Dryococelus australis]
MCRASSYWEFVTRKLFLTFEGPYRVINITRNNCYELADITGKSVGMFNITQLKSYRSKNSYLQLNTSSSNITTIVLKIDYEDHPGRNCKHTASRVTNDVGCSEDIMAVASTAHYSHSALEHWWLHPKACWEVALPTELNAREKRLVASAIICVPSRTRKIPDAPRHTENEVILSLLWQAAYSDSVAHVILLHGRVVDGMFE